MWAGAARSSPLLLRRGLHLSGRRMLRAVHLRVVSLVMIRRGFSSAVVGRSPTIAQLLSSVSSSSSPLSSPPSSAATCLSSASPSSPQPSSSSSSASSSTQTASLDFSDSQASSATTVHAFGWVRSVRAQKQHVFLNVSDGSCLEPLQAVIPAELLGPEERTRLTTGAAVRVEGALQAHPARAGEYELLASRVDVIGDCPADYPMQKKRHTLEYLRGQLHLRPRTNTISSVLRVRSQAALAIHDYLAGTKDLLHVHTPIITPLDCEGGAALFDVVASTDIRSPLPSSPDADTPSASDDNSSPSAPSLPSPLSSSAAAAGPAAAAGSGHRARERHFFGHRSHLSVSGQLYGELCASAFHGIYTFGPTFRAEHSNSQHHLAEFWMVEPELSFADLDKAIELAEGLVRATVRRVSERCAPEIDFFEQHGGRDKLLLKRRLSACVSDEPYARITYTGAISALRAARLSTETHPELSRKKRDALQKLLRSIEWGNDLSSTHEQWLARTHFGERPVFVTHYPRSIKPFYMRVTEADRAKPASEQTAECMDLIVPGAGELAGGSAREHEHSRLLAQMHEHELPLDAYQWYLDLRRFGSVPHAGFGLGFERLVQLLTGVDNVRDLTLVPRAYSPGDKDAVGSLGAKI